MILWVPQTHTIFSALAQEACSHLASSYHLGDSLPRWGPWPDLPLREEGPPGPQGGYLLPITSAFQ